MSCEYCDDSNHFILNDSFISIRDFCILAGDEELKMTGNQILKFEECITVYIDRGYLRMTGDDSACMDHGEKIKINFCPVCGEWLTNPDKNEVENPA